MLRAGAVELLREPCLLGLRAVELLGVLRAAPVQLLAKRLRGRARAGEVGAQAVGLAPALLGFGACRVAGRCRGDQVAADGVRVAAAIGQLAARCEHLVLQLVPLRDEVVDAARRAFELADRAAQLGARLVARRRAALHLLGRATELLAQPLALREVADEHMPEAVVAIDPGPDGERGREFAAGAVAREERE